MIRFTFSFDFDPATEEIKNVKMVGKEAKQDRVPYDTPVLVLKDNLYELSSKATECLGIEPGDKVDISYRTINGKITPVIASAKTWGSESGNKLTKALTVSYRGSSNKMLQEYGKVFDLIPQENTEGVFILKEINETLPELPKEIELPSSDLEEDLPEELSKEDVFEEMGEDKFELKDIDFESLND